MVSEIYFLCTYSYCFCFALLQDGVTADVMALAKGHVDVGELLTKMKPVSLEQSEQNL